MPRPKVDSRNAILATGIPVVTNKGVVGVEKILGSNRCGVLVPGLTENDLAAAARQALSLIEGEHVPEAYAKAVAPPRKSISRSTRA